MEVIDSDLVPKSSSLFLCKLCDYYTSRKSQYHRHLLTDKHKIKENDSNLVPKSSKLYECKCGKIYKYDSGYYRHKKICLKEIPKCIEDCSHVNVAKETQPANLITTELVMELIKDNKEMKQLIMEQSTTLTNIVHDVINNRVVHTNNTNNTNNHNIITNSNNKAFNLNLYLNETCKEAINMSDFVSSIKMNLDDLEHTGRKGYIEGISSIILKNLNKIEQHLRPLHCSDNKREILYIKDNNEWTKECYNKPILTKAIKVIANENIKQIKTWREKNPDCTNADSKKNNLYLKIVSNSMNGLTEEEGNKNINKIISNLAKQTNIDKSLSYNN